MNSLKTASGTCLALSLMACATTSVSHEAEETEEADYRISVEIPLDELHLAEAEILKVDELLNERTAFDAEDFQLDEVVLIARADHGASGNAELLVLEWRSGQVDIPEGGEEDWFEVRIPAPDEELGGAWLLDVTGGVTLDMLVAVLTPRPRLVADYEEKKTVYRTSRTTVYRDRVAYPRTYHVHWIYDPNRYYVYHYHGIWPYRYYIGPWEYRYYDLSYRPYRRHYGPIYRPRPPRYRHHGYRYRARIRDAAPPRRAAREFRRIDPELVKLRHNHPRLQPFRESREARRASPRPGRRASSDVARQNNPRSSQRRLRTEPSANRTARTAPALATADSAAGRRARDGAGTRDRTADLNRLQRRSQDTRQQRQAAAGEPRNRVLRQVERKPTATAQRQTAPTRPVSRQAQTARSTPRTAPSVRSRAPQRHAEPARSTSRQAQSAPRATRVAPPVRSRAPQRQAESARGASRQARSAPRTTRATSPVRSRAPQRQTEPARATSRQARTARTTPRTTRPQRAPTRQAESVGNVRGSVSPARTPSVRSRQSPRQTAPAQLSRQTPMVGSAPRTTTPSRANARTRTLSRAPQRTAPAPHARRPAPTGDDTAPARRQSRKESPSRSNARTRSLQPQRRSTPAPPRESSRSSSSRTRTFERR